MLTYTYKTNSKSTHKRMNYECTCQSIYCEKYNCKESQNLVPTLSEIVLPIGTLLRRINNVVILGKNKSKMKIFIHVFHAVFTCFKRLYICIWID